MNELLILAIGAGLFTICTIIGLPLAYLEHRIHGGKMKFWEFVISF